MPFLLAFWKPIAVTLLVITLVAAIGLTKHNYDERRRDEGRSEVQMKWDAVNAAQKVREAKAAAEADDFQRRADAKRDADFKRLLVERTTEIQNRLAASHISIDLSRSLSNATRTANEQGTGKPAQADPPAASAPDELAVAIWFDQVAMMYRTCRERVDAWIKWDDERIKQ